MQSATFDDRWPAGTRSYLEFMRPRLEQCRRLLGERGTLYVHADWRAGHYLRIQLDEVFGHRNFLNEIVWHYRTGGLSNRWFARKHDTILVYARSLGRHRFNVIRQGEFRTDGLKRDARGRPYKSTRKGRLYFHTDGPALTDVWDIPFLSTVSLERTGWPAQKAPEPDGADRRCQQPAGRSGGGFLLWQRHDAGGREKAGPPLAGVRHFQAGNRHRRQAARRRWAPSVVGRCRRSQVPFAVRTYRGVKWGRRPRRPSHTTDTRLSK